MQQPDESADSAPGPARPAPHKHTPPFRRLRVYAFDPSSRDQLEKAVINQVTLKVPWETNDPATIRRSERHCELQRARSANTSR